MDQVRATAGVFSCLFTSPAWIPHFRFITVLAPAAFPLDECRSVDKCLVPLTQMCAPAWRAVLFIACRWQSDMEPWWLPDEQGTAESLRLFFSSSSCWWRWWKCKLTRLRQGRLRKKKKKSEKQQKNKSGTWTTFLQWSSTVTVHAAIF